MSTYFVIAEHLQGTLTETTFETLGAARALADATGGEVVGVVLGHNVGDLAGQLTAADRVLVLDHPALEHFSPEAYIAALDPVLREQRPRLTLFQNTAMGMDLAANFSVRLNWPLVAYCNDLRAEDGAIITTSQIYGGKVFAESAFDSEPGIVTVLAGAFPADEGRTGGMPAVETVPPDLGELHTRFKALHEPEAGDVDITKADIIVSVGRGIQSEDNIEVAEELAQALGGVVASSRPVVDAGWLPRARQVGKSGQKVKPKLYLALGISGAPEHVEGMKDSELIIAVNTDPNAPIFDVAHYGVVADLFDIADALLETLEA